MKVWRVAHKNRTENGFPAGPYGGADVIGDAARALRPMKYAHGDEQHPGPYWDEKLMYINSHEVCGLVSLEALYIWFHNFTRILDEHGFAVYCYEVPDDTTRVGAEGQALFDRNTAKLVSVEDLDLKPAQTALF